ncbi:MAG: hypothetical protein IJP88_08860, partial [Synergistaceae bacterium]|nr:hypothetical protein [Synergistaceae bacterium]
DNRDHSDPVIDYQESVSVIAGGTARAVFTGKHINSWKYGNLPDEIKAVELNYAANPNRCDVLVTASSKAAAGAKTVTIYAYNEIGEETSADLSVTIISDSEKGNYDKPVIDGNKSVSVAKGGTARAVFTGKNIRAWAYGNLPDGIKAIELNYAANPNKCEVLVTASSTAQTGSKTVTIYAYNEIGEVTSKTLNVNIIDDGAKYDEAVIDPVKTVSVVQGGTVHVSLTGKNIVLWTYGNLPDGIKSLEFIYNNNPNKCTAAITAGSKAETGSKTITVYAFNEIGKYVSKTLTVNVIAAGSGSGGTPTPTPTIDSDDLEAPISVVPGGKISVSFDATNIYGLAYSVLPNEIDYVDWEVNDTGTKGVFFIAASSAAEVGNTMSIDVYGFNEIGEVSGTAPINLTVVEDKGNNNPVTKKSEETIVFEPGAIITDEFTSKGAKNWYFDLSKLPDVVNAIDVSYDIDNPETCAVTIMVSSNTSLFEADYDNSASDFSVAADNNYSFKVYAYDEVGSVASTDFTFTVSDSDDGDTDTDTDTDSDVSSHGSSSGCETGAGMMGLLLLAYSLVSRKK